MNFISFKPENIMIYHNSLVNMSHRDNQNTLSLIPSTFHEDLNSNISAEVVEDLANVLKDNMRLTTISKTKSCISRKSSRASPYRIPTRCIGNCDKIPCIDCEHKHRRNMDRLDNHDDPYELLQKLIQSGNLVSEAVRRLTLTLDMPPKSKQFYESDDENSCTPKRHNVSYENVE